MIVEFGNDRRNVILSLSICTLSVANPDPGSGAFLTPGSGMGKRSGSGMKNPDHISECLVAFFRVKILRFFVADLGSGMVKIWIGYLPYPG
jgi:hypothetical protein